MHRLSCKPLLQFVLLCLLAMLAESITFPGDIEALEQVKASITAASISPTSCLGTWNFSIADPCDSLSSTVFTCGFRCSSINNYSRVISLSLGAGGYQGILPPYLGNLTALIVLDMSKNSLHGPIPPSMAALPALQSLDLSQNSLSGPIPPLLPPSLQELYLSSNQLQGPIPASLSLLTNLHSLYIDNNLLSGAIPPLANLSSLLRLVASGNRLTGEVPSGDHLPPPLVQLSLANNSLTGSLPASLIDLKQLEVLDVRSNGLTGGLDARLLVTTALQQLNLSSNHLTSLDMADEAAHQSTSSELTALDLGFNLMTGALPPLLTSLPKLVSLSLRYNRFIGGIPMEYALKATTTKDETPFTRLFLDGNFLTGPLPPPFLAATPGLSGSLVNNCLPTCPSNLTLCQGGDQRPAAQCQTKR